MDPSAHQWPLGHGPPQTEELRPLRLPMVPAGQRCFTPATQNNPSGHLIARPALQKEPLGHGHCAVRVVSLPLQLLLLEPTGRGLALPPGQ